MKVSFWFLILSTVLILALTVLIEPASAQGLVIYHYPIVVGTLGDNDFYTSDVTVIWPVQEGSTILEGCETTHITEDTSPEGVELVCILQYSGNTYAGQIVIKRDTTPPVVVTNIPGSSVIALNEGQAYQLDASDSFDMTSGVASIAWSLDEDELFNDGNPTIYYALDGLSETNPDSNWITAKVIDQAGNIAQEAFPVLIYNLPPVFEALLDVATLYGSYELFAPFNDAGVLDNHSASIDWGDGIIEEGIVLEGDGTGLVMGRHSYERVGLYTVSIHLEDKDGSVGLTSVNVHIRSTESVPISIEGRFSHPSGGEVYNTLIQYASPLIFSATGSQAEARLGLDSGGCFGQLTFASGEGDPQYTEALIVCLTRPAETADDFNAWLSGDTELPGPELEVSLRLFEIEQDGTSIWTNTDPLTVGVFVQGCHEPDYQRLGDLEFSSGDFSLSTGIDTTNLPQVSISGSPQLTNIDETTWSFIQTECDQGYTLPLSAPGVSIEFEGGTVPVAIDSETLTGGLRLLQDSIGAYAYDGMLALDNSIQLTHALDKVVNAWRNLQDGKALHELNKFIADVVKLVDQNRLLMDDGDWLVGEASFLIARALDRQSPVAPDPIPGEACEGDLGSCPETYAACSTSPDYLTFYVDDDSLASEPDGSPSAPFASLTEALSLAEAHNACGVKLLIAPGYYSGDLTITRHTQFFGQGNPRQVRIQGLISNAGANVLEIFHVKVIGNPLGLPTGISANHPCARVYLVDVIVEGVYGYGIRQHGGSLLVWETTIQDTKALPEFISQGSGIYLTCGTQAGLFDVDLIGNQSSGLQIVGGGTDVRAYDLAVRNTGMHPSYLATAEETYESGPSGTIYFAPIVGTGGIHIRDEASLIATHVEIRDNLSSGINVTGGGTARLENVTLTGSHRYHGYNTEGEWLAGHGANALTTLGGHLRIYNFLNQYAEKCGNQIALAGEMDLRSGEVSHNPIGMCLQVSDYDLDRLTSTVNYANDIEIQSQAKIIPDRPDYQQDS